jgi:hypothetical protein
MTQPAGSFRLNTLLARDQFSSSALFRVEGCVTSYSGQIEFLRTNVTHCKSYSLVRMVLDLVSRYSDICAELG